MPPFFPLALGLLLFLSLPVSNTASAGESDTVVLSKSGPLKGKRVSTGSGNVTAYLGIPYAEPPVRKLRFKKPLPHQPWNHVLEATSFGTSCQQPLLNSLLGEVWVANKPHSEDCLFLNIWVPHPQPSVPMPVLVWIHGGGYFVGAASLDLYNGAFLAATEKVIVASMNYRLGALGFLFLPPDIPGNMGLWDQWLALKWIKENADVFGGDPARVTLFGHSAGGASVGYHLLSPASQPLFAHAAVQSGASYSSWAWVPPQDANAFSMTVSQRLTCGNQNYSMMVSCLQDTTGDQQVLNEMAPMFKPTTDEDFLPGEPYQLLCSGLYQAKPLLAGITGDDGSLMVAITFPKVLENDGILSWEEIEKMMETPEKTIALSYSENRQGPAKYREAFSYFYRDYFLLCPIIEFSEKLLASGSPVYAYTFNHHISTSVWPDWAGSIHGMELPYLFRTFASVLGTNQSYTEEDVLLSRRMMHYWAEFARNGKPTGLGAEEVQWPIYNSTEQRFFHITTQTPQIMQLSPVPKCDLLAPYIEKARKTKPFREDIDQARKDKKNETKT